jgi:hypothetical protein
MNGLIGNHDYAKFVFLGVDNDADLPNKSKLLNYFPSGTFNIYKAHGYFSNSFHELEKFYAIKRNGFKADVTRGMKTCISHGIRIITDEPPNSFLALEFGASIVDFLDLSHSDMEELTILVDRWSQLTSTVSRVLACLDHIEQAKLILNKNNLSDSKIENPDEQSLSLIFDNYGDLAIKQMVDRFDAWYQKVIWR